MTSTEGRAGAPALACGCSAPTPAGVWLWVRLAAGAFLAVNIMSLSLSVNLSETTPRERTFLYAALIGGTLLVAGLVGQPLVVNAWRELRSRRVTIEALFLLGIGGALAQSFLAVATGRGAVYFEVVAILLVVYALGRSLVSRSQQSALDSLSRVRAETDCELVLPDGSTRKVASGDLKPGDVVLVKPGQIAPVDGTVISGQACLEEAHLTGEGFLRPVRPGDPVLAGVCPVDAAIQVRTAAAAGESAFSLALDHVSRSLQSPARLERTADRLARWFAPLVLGAALLTLAAWGLTRGWPTGLMNGLAVLLIACPCAIGFATPLAFWSSVRRLAAIGMAVRGGDCVERLATADTVILDKTGTLTSESWRIARAEFLPVPGVDEPFLRRLVAAAERASNHPIAAAFRDFDSGLSGPPLRVDSLSTLPGRGFKASLAGPAGSRWDVTIGLADNQPDQAARRLSVLVNGGPAAVVDLEESILPSVRSAVAELHGLRVETIVATGDAARRALAIPAGRHYASLTPAGKISLVEELQAAGRKVLFVGDGLNDSAAMAAAHASIAAPGSVDLTASLAGGVLLHDDLRAIPRALAAARQALAVARSNLLFAAGYNAAGIAIAAAGLVHPVTSVLLMTCSSLFVCWRASRLLPGNQNAEGVSP
ncbi:MAG: heavy metal translocating P-type ATPase [Bryobacteraceae bacterium]